MHLSPQRKLLLTFNSNIFMGSYLLKCTVNHPPSSRFSSSQEHFFQIHRELLFSAFSPKPISPIYHSLSGYSYTPHAALPIPRPISSVDLETLDIADSKQLSTLRQKLLEIGIDGNDFMPGQYNCLICPHCKGGDSREKSLSVRITKDRGAAMWTCFQAKCGWRGTTHAFADVRSTFARMNRIIIVKQPIRKITEESLQLEPLCNKIVIAFTYRRNGELLSCKYRDITKKVWQGTNTEKIFYGLDDIKEASDIIIVEGEMDKLASKIVCVFLMVLLQKHRIRHYLPKKRTQNINTYGTAENILKRDFE